VDVTTLGSIVRIEIESNFILYIMEDTDLNECTFNENTCYHVFPNFRPSNGYLMRLSNEIEGAKFHYVDMIHIRQKRALFNGLYKVLKCKVGVFPARIHQG
jgi:hypothetical protein